MMTSRGDLPFDFPYLIRICALMGSVLVVGMVLTFLVYGIGQDPLQFMHTPAEYSQILLRNPQILKVAIGMDNAFILFYSCMFLALAVCLWREGAPRPMVAVSAALLGLSGLLDMGENMHFMSMIGVAQQGLGVSSGEIEFQVWESLLKFHVSYFGLFLLSFALPANMRMEKLLVFLVRWVQWPVGMLIYLTPESLAKPLVFVRFTFFLVAMLLLAAIYRRNAVGSNVPA
jgi:hypothetical protein